MFICRDVSRESYISVYWEDDCLFIVVKRLTNDGELQEQVAVSYTRDTAREFLSECQQSPTIHGVELTKSNMAAVTEQISGGLKAGDGRSPVSRITPDMWN